MSSCVPGSSGEHELQRRYGTEKRAAAFYDTQMLDHLNEQMREFMADQEMVFIASADAHGECDASFRSGPRGFVRPLDAKTVLYPEFRGNGVMGSLGNIAENGHIGLLFVDFFRASVGLHVNGRAFILEDAAVQADMPRLQSLPGWPEEGTDATEGLRKPERWVMVHVEEAYIHCSKNIPQLAKVERRVAWGVDEQGRKGGDFFAAKRLERPWAVRAARKAAADTVRDLPRAA
jgi:uncharacterized protein